MYSSNQSLSQNKPPQGDTRSPCLGLFCENDWLTITPPYRICSQPHLKKTVTNQCINKHKKASKTERKASL